MRTRIILLALLLSAHVVVAQEMPLVYEVENTCVDCPTPYLPSFNELPSVEALPDPFRWSDGRGRITNFSDWAYRRAEIAAEIQHYEIGQKPGRPDSITASYANGTLTVNVTVNGNTLTLTSPVTLPDGEGPFPAIIGMAFGTGLPESMLTSRGIAQISFNFAQVMAHTQTRGSEPINRLYPELTYIGAYSAWPWGVSRLIDGLELVQDDLPIDLAHLGVSGCSFAGKMAIFSGAFDERIALTIGIESGGGGYTTWRFSETLGNVETLGRTSHAWFIEDMFQFSNAVPKLPMDHHELMAMVAPRALLVTGNPDYEWLADESGHVGSKAVQEVYNALGVPDRFGYSIVRGHPHCQVPSSQIPEIGAFLDKFLLGIDSVNTNVATSSYNTNLAPWITWTTPTLSNGTSYFGKASLVSPANLQEGLDTTITFKWNQAEGAEKYFFQLSTNPVFANLAVSDSTTDTLKTINGLLKGKRYYWRIQIKNNAGSAGPWSDQWNFTTGISLPTAPQLVSAAPNRATRSDYVTLTWRKVTTADEYLVQLSEEESFAGILNSASTTDTVGTLNGTSEGNKYYWRVQAENVAGTSPWSEVANFALILPPTGLTLQSRASNEITLTWRDNSKVEDGYIIERKQDGQSAFAVLDTLEGSGSRYTDAEIELGQTHTYRVQAYKDFAVSGYSNEASLFVTSIKEDAEVPTEYSMSQNYPNPFWSGATSRSAGNPATTITFAVPKRSTVLIKIFDVVGKEVMTVVDNEFEPGIFKQTFNADGLTSGIYFYRMEADGFSQTRKLMFLR